MAERCVGVVLNSMKAVSVGALTAIAGAFAFGVIVTVVVGTLGGLDFGSVAAVRRVVHRTMAADVYVMLSVLGGLAFTACGGFRAARIADRLHILHAAIVGLAAMILFAPIAPGGAETRLLIVAVLLSMPAALLGGMLGKRRPRDLAQARRELRRLSALR